MGPPQRCVVVVVIVTTARILRSRYRNEMRREKTERGVSRDLLLVNDDDQLLCRMRRGGRRQS